MLRFQGEIVESVLGHTVLLGNLSHRSPQFHSTGGKTERLLGCRLQVGSRLGRAANHQSHLSSDLGRGPLGKLLQRPTTNFLVSLGELTADRPSAIGAKCECHR